MITKNEKGVALILSLFVITILVILGSVFIVRTIGEKNMSDRDRMATQAFYIAEGGSEKGLNRLDILINTDMLSAVNATTPQVIASDADYYTNQRDGLSFLEKYAKEGNVAQFVLSPLPPQVPTRATHTGIFENLGSGSFQYKIIVTEKSDPIRITTDQWDFPYYYRIETNGLTGGVSKKIVFTGDFTVRVQRDNFAKFALFTNTHTMPDGTLVWFTANTNFSGPVHTNSQLNFAMNPSGTFDGLVTQVNPNARFLNGGTPIQINADANPPRDVPTFNAGFNRNVPAITLASSIQKQDMINQARGGDNTSGNGIFVANNGSSLTGGIYVNGNATVSMALDGNDNAAYTIAQGSTTKIITVDTHVVGGRTTVQTVGGSTQTFNGLPDGMANVGTTMDGNGNITSSGAIVYVNGSITNLGGTVQRGTELTIASESDIKITNHVRYSEFTPAVGTPGTPGYVPPNADGKTNLLGLVSWSGNVRIGTGAPDNVNVHGIAMAQNGIFTVDSYYTGNPRGVATLLGGAITGNYGAFGVFKPSTGQLLAGYGRNFVYDSRTLLGKSPPYFPSMRTFIAFSNDIKDKIAWQEGGF